MVFNGDKWYYLAVKKLSALWRSIESKHYSGFNCLNCLHYFRTKKKLESNKKACESKDFCNVAMSSEDIEFNWYQKSDEALLFMQILSV